MFRLVLALLGCGVADASPEMRPVVPPTVPVVQAEVPPKGLVVHEWGTFTAVAGPDGAPVLGHPLDGSSELPSFVYGPNRLQDGLRVNGYPTKSDPGFVRMETPVLYFYTPVEQTIDVSVRFVDGALTEWYPRVRSYDGAGLDWGTVKLLPQSEATLPQDGSESHYYPARNVKSARVQVCDERNDEQEQFLFYRGLGQFPLSVRAVAEAGTVRLWTAEGPGKVGQVLLFERHGEKVGFSLVEPRGTPARPVLDDTLQGVYDQIVTQLISAGLYRPEALAMVETWKGDWFEDGLRVMYLVPRAETDARLPLTLSPKPDALVRVLVGRLEVSTPEQKKDLVTVLDGKGTDATVLAQVKAKFGRFAEPMLATSGHSRATALLSKEAGQGAVTTAD